MLTLVIAHNIFLTRDQRYVLYEGNSIEAVGVSIPVWFFKGTTSEPACEVFCKYLLTNAKKDIPISITEQGSYMINMPQAPDNYKTPKITDKKWREISDKEKYYEEYPEIDTAENLLDIEDNGSEYLNFNQYNKVKKDNKMMNVVHCVEILAMKQLEETLVF